MIPTKFEQANIRFVAPPDLDESQVMTIWGYLGTVNGGNLDGSQIAVVAWQPTADEVAQIVAGQPIFLSFVGGLPPHFPCMEFESAIRPG